MGIFKEQEKPRQSAFKQASETISQSAKRDGLYKNHSYPYCLPRAHSIQNLYPEIREPITGYFSKYAIKWHDAIDGLPGNHMCDSMVCCANFLFPFADKPLALAALLSRVYPNIKQMLPVEDGHYIAHEWIGAENYLREKLPKHGQRKRGALFTSADAAVRFEQEDGRIQFTLIEWKYTEAYSSTWIKYAKSGTDRTLIYRHLYDADEDLLDQEIIPSFDDLFYEPFYQFMRQQYLAHEMEKARELDADIVSLLHIAPAHNHDFKRVTSPVLKPLGQSATEVWANIVKKPVRFLSVGTEDLFGNFDILEFPDLEDWFQYICTRYTWVLDN